MRKSPIDHFEEARRCLKNLFTNISPQKDRPEIVETRTKGLEEEVSYRELIQDLYFSHLEDDPRDKRSYAEQLEEFQEWYKKLPPGTDRYLVERMILRPGYSNLSEEESKELRNKYFRKPPVKISVVKVS